MALCFVALFTLGAASSQRVPKPVERKAQMHIRVLGAKGRDCRAARKVERMRGKIPDDARAIVELRVLSDEAATLQTLEDALAEQCAVYCCSGFSVQQATTAEDGKDGFIEVRATGWEAAQTEKA